MSFEVGQTYSVSCIMHTIEYYDGYDEVAKQSIFTKETIAIPVYPLSHNDIENGQEYKHYHANYQFINQQQSKAYLQSLQYNRIEDVGQELVYLDLVCLHEAERTHMFATPTYMLPYSKFKKPCIHKGKCPHRGYDLSNVKPINGIIKCPLHSLEFDAVTKELVSVIRKSEYKLEKKKK